MKSFARRDFVQFAGAALAAPFVSRRSWAQTWPNRPIRAIVPLSAGTGVDILSRVVLNELSMHLGQPIVIDNRPGAAGTIGAAAAAKAEADGYTILTDSATHTVVPSMYSNLAYDPIVDFASIVPLGASPLILTVAPPTGIGTVSDLISAAASKHGTLTFASGGTGTTNHLAAERFRLGAGFQAVHIPFRGSGYLADLLAGRVDFAFSPLTPVIDLIRDGRLRALAVASPKRTEFLPDVPTMREVGIANSDTAFWVGMFAPVKTARAIVDRLNQETIKVLRIRRVQDSFAKFAAEPMAMSPFEFDTMVRAEFVANAVLAKSIGLTAI